MRLLLIASLLLQLTTIRNPAVVEEFKRLSGYPHGRKGFVADHSIPLCAGGPDTVDNMKWQEVHLSYRKDVFERELCAEMKRQGYIMVKADGK